MQILTIKAATVESAAALYSAMSAFQPELETDDEGGCYVSFDLGSDKRVLEVLNALEDFLAVRAESQGVASMSVALDGRS